MAEVLLMEFNKEKRHFQALKEVELASIPASGEKIVLDIDGIGYIFKVYDVHYSEDRRVDVNIIRISTTTEYYSSGYQDIN